MSVDVGISATENLFGKVVSNLQTGVYELDGVIYGTSYYVDDYTGFSQSEELQHGNFVALHFYVPEVDPEDVTITLTLTDTKNLDSDGIAVLHITDKDSQVIKAVASMTGYAPITKVYALSGLTCEEADDD